MLFNKNEIKVASSVLELINRRRRQILVHSYLYYKMDTNLIQDHVFDKWCRELMQLHIKHPTESRRAVFWSVYKDWNGFSGYDLFTNDKDAEEWAKRKAEQLMG